MFGTRLKILREGDDLSQAKFAQEIGFSQSSIASWENGTREPGMNTLIKIAQCQYFGHIKQKKFIYARVRDSLFISFRAASPRPFSPPISSNTEKAACGFPFSFYHISEARSPGFPVSIIPLFPLFARSGRPPPAPSRYIIYYKHI